MIARWQTVCAKCDTTIHTGDQMKARYVRDGFDPDTHRPLWRRVPKAYVHAPRCPKKTPPPGVDPLTGERTVSECLPAPHQETLL